MVQAVRQRESATRIIRLTIKESDFKSIAHQDISDFITKKSLFLFDQFELSYDLLEKAPELWQADEDYQNCRLVLKDLKVVNDIAERGVALIERYNNSLTKSEEQMQYLLQINETDGLSHKVCVKCLGALEFLCDFQEQCHKTQERLAEENRKSQNIVLPTELETSRDLDYDKENVSPIIQSGIKRKRQNNPEVQKYEKIKNTTSDGKINKIEDKKINEIEEPTMSKIEGPKMSKIEEPKMSKIEEPKINNIEEPKMSKIEETKMAKIEEPKMSKIEETKMNKIEETKMRNIEESRISNIEESKMRKIDESKMSKIEEPIMSKIEETKMSKIEETKMRKIEESKISKIEEPKMSKIEETKISKIEQPKMRKIEEPKMSQIEETKMSKIEQPKMRKIEESKMSKIEETKMSKIEEPKMSKIEEPKMSKIDEPKMSKNEETKMSKIEEPKMRKIAESKISKIDEPKVRKIEESKMSKIEEPKMSKIEERKMNNIDEQKMSKIEKPKISKIEEPKMSKIDEPKMSKIDEKKITKIEEKKIKKLDNTQRKKIISPKDRKVTRKITNFLIKSNSPKIPAKITSTAKISEKNIIDEASTKCSPKHSLVNDQTNPNISKNDKSSIIPKTNEQPKSVIVKNENNDDCKIPVTSIIEKNSKMNKMVWITNLSNLPEIQSPRTARFEKLHDVCPKPGDEADKRVKSRREMDEKFLEKTRKSPAMEIARNSVVVEKTKIVETMKNENNGRKRETREVVKKMKIREDLYVEDDEESDEEDEEENNAVGAKKFGKITDLMSEEQKVTIEKFYNCDMSAVDEQAVGEKIIFLDRKKFGCRLCDATYTRQDKCQVHIWGHLDMRPYRCKACNFSTVTVSNIRCHVRKNHLKIKPYVCEFCDKRYVTAFLLDEHTNTHTGERPYRCDKCNFTSTSRQGLSYHKTTHKLVKDITCHVCGKEFYSKGRLRAHLIIHNKDKAANMCKLCSIYLCNAEALQKHHANVHNRDYVCDDCGKRCKSKKALNNHRNVHTAAKYKCNLCSNVYKSSHILKEHLLKHKGIRKYKCNKCEKDFAQQSHLAAHMAVHSDKRFFCPGCKRPFNRHDNMKMHTKRCETFRANPDLVNLLSIRKIRSNSPESNKNEEKSAETEETISSSENEDDYTKTDYNTSVERSNEILNVTSSVNEHEENFTTIIVENTIPCT